MSKWKFVQAKWYTPVPDSTPRKIRVVCVHDMEFWERPDSAEAIANDFATRPASQKSSAHLCVDNNSVVQCVRDRDVAWSAPNANHDGLHIELAGYKSQTAEQWRDVYSIAVLALGADAAALYCIKYSLPVRRLTVAQVKDGKSKGICGHDDVTRAFKNPTGHMDPGPSFPWDLYLAMVAQFVKDRTQRIAA